MSEKIKTSECRRWVIKIGSALLTGDGEGLNREVLAPWVDQMTALRKEGADLVLVSSGAVAEGMSRMGWRLSLIHISEPTRLDARSRMPSSA